MKNMKGFLKRIDDKKIRIGIIGFGYVGMPLAVEFAEAGYEVTGIEIDKEKVKLVMKGRSYIGGRSLSGAEAACRIGKAEGIVRSGGARRL